MQIDASIWITQFLKANRDPDTGQVRPAAHLIGFIRRICKLLFHGIQPVFVFDGATPEIKLRELNARRKRKLQWLGGFDEGSEQAVKKMARKLLVSTLRQGKEVELSKSFARGDSKPRKNGLALAPGFILDDDINHPLDGSQVGSSSSSIYEVSTSKESPAVTTLLDKRETDDIIEIPDEENDEEEEQPFIFPEEHGEVKLDIHTITSLPPKMRKVAFEAAKRELRIRSRKECISAASDPAAYSNVQLKSFLKTTSMNKQIRQAATISKNDSVYGNNDHVKRDKVQTTGTLFQPLQADDSDIEDSYDGYWSDEYKDRLKTTGIKIIPKSVDLTNEKCDQNPCESIEHPSSRRIQENMYDEPNNFKFVSSEYDGYSDDSEQGGGFIPIPMQSPRKDVTPLQQVALGTKSRGIYASTHDALAALSSDNAAETLKCNTLSEDILHPSKLTSTGDSRTDANRSGGEKSDAMKESYDVIDFQDDSDVEWEDGEKSPLSEGLRGMTHIDDLYNLNYKSNDTDSIKTSNKLDSEIISPPAIEDADPFHSPHRLSMTRQQASELASVTEQQALLLSESSTPNIGHTDSMCHELDERESNAIIGGSSSLPASAPPPLQETALFTALASVNEQQALRLSESTTPNIDHTDSMCHELNERESNAIIGGSSSLSASVPPPPQETALFDLSLEGLQREEGELRDEWNKYQRDTDFATDEHIDEVKCLIQLFGIPIVQAPAEAEAQCAAMEKMGLVDGVVTEDSDALVFGADTVYKNIFDDKMFVEVYHSKELKKLGISRNELLALAMLLGGDYTDGVKGVGIVNGMEIIKAFPVEESVKDGLSDFRKWLEDDEVSFAPGSLQEQFHLKHLSARLRWTTPNEFPSPNVLHAYMNPVVDCTESTKAALSWDKPDVQALKKFCKLKLDWSEGRWRMALVFYFISL